MMISNNNRSVNFTHTHTHRFFSVAMALMLVLFGTVGCNEEVQAPEPLLEVRESLNSSHLTLEEALSITFADVNFDSLISQMRQLEKYISKEEFLEWPQNFNGDIHAFSDYLDTTIPKESEFYKANLLMLNKTQELKLLYPEIEKLEPEVIMGGIDNYFTSIELETSIIPFSSFGPCEDDLISDERACKIMYFLSQLATGLGTLASLAYPPLGIGVYITGSSLALYQYDNCLSNADRIYEMCLKLEELEKR